MAWHYNTKVIREGRSWVDDAGIKHPTSWGSWSDADKAAAGLVWVADAAPYDSRYYWSADLPKDLDALKEEHVARVKKQAAGLLATTDWYVVRKAETAEDIPTEVLQYRADVRAVSNAAEAVIMAVTSINELASYATPWPTTGEEHGTTEQRPDQVQPDTD